MNENAWKKLHSGLECPFLGMSAVQFYVDLYLWELFFRKYKIESMIEFGTGQGGMSIFFLLQSIQNNFSFDTFDINIPGYLHSPIAEFLQFKDSFFQGNIWEDRKDLIIKLLINNRKPILLYTDNGSKSKEMKDFSSYLKSGDFLVTHDWNTEVSRKSISEIIDSFEQLLVEECVEMESLTGFFRKK
jgi:cephalosporin hydroxylase